MIDWTFDETTHTYRLNGAIVPSVTTVLRELGAASNFGFLSPQEREYHQSRGHAVHRMVELLVLGTLDKRTIRPVKKYLIGWERFCNDHNVEVLNFDGKPFVETPLVHPVFRFGCRPDVAIKARFLGKWQTGPAELKATAAHAPATALQLAAQRLAIKHYFPEIGDLRIGLRLLPKEPYYECRPYQDPSDEGTWLSFLNCYHWRARHK